MGKSDFLTTPKAIANRIKYKGLQKLRWSYPKQYRDELRRRDEFRTEFLELLKRRFGTKRVHNNIVYNEYISHREHVHINATQWETLTDFTKWLGREVSVKWMRLQRAGTFSIKTEIQKQSANSRKRKKQDLDDEERTAKFIEQQVKKGMEGAEQLHLI
ncbi:DNA/RNA-binding protein KIN17 isoform X2 [Xenopus laevis]|uniref:DNA/RNA-binding protein KIN17 isoform X2 n=1 Tax=Xenopus laevis TaxID=8355 RepID=A0A8J1ML91_XENLA|nr:DNA/RNA-binding protein KIN17 isoform X2 [Xenopus laevis]